ncbi:hypothetical protein P7C70_g3782, partial [Phenoliferia sp. Uapishka_3]
MPLFQTFSPPKITKVDIEEPSASLHSSLSPPSAGAPSPSSTPPQPISNNHYSQSTTLPLTSGAHLPAGTTTPTIALRNAVLDASPPPHLSAHFDSQAALDEIIEIKESQETRAQVGTISSEVTALLALPSPDFTSVGVHSGTPSAESSQVSTPLTEKTMAELQKHQEIQKQVLDLLHEAASSST